jgi:hypothetical protein
MHPFATDPQAGPPPLRRWAALLIAAGLAVAALAVGRNALAAMPPVQATLDSSLIQRTMALPIAKADIFLIDDTLRYLGLKEESDLFRRHMKRLEYTAKLSGVEPERTITAKEAIARERGQSEDSLLRLHEAYYRKNIEVELARDGEIPYQARGSTIHIQIAPGVPLWSSKYWDVPNNYASFYFGVKVSYREPPVLADAPPPPEIKAVLDDGRTLDLKCAFDLLDLARQEKVIDWCGSRKERKIDREIVAMAQ